MTTSILASIGALTVILTAATHIPAALASLIRSFIPVIAAIHALRTSTRPSPTEDKETLRSRSVPEAGQRRRRPR
ncbi:MULTISPECIES: hypothetical protein [unclassified Streptomyces]|uniref:hypothetical protein n=1 Tax=unclassified Streptomyces TaxID=2593676 RepID=UPI002DD85324|nr:hypothetical protein [Streptomyces sp. NBC_01750]WSB05046.1 hypothetical protein OIE54_41110 [Streptomyces sp. NBC_01794]WSD30684.1 hypothetical protein OG966_01025 [Streptomyces sp. NBC_01750]